MKLSVHQRWIETSFLLLSSLGACSGYFNTHQEIVDLHFLDCDPDLYYNELLSQEDDPLLWTKRDLQNLTEGRHRGIVPFEVEQWGDDDIYQAVMDLDGTETDHVKLIYRNASLSTRFKGFIWDIERLWSVQEGGGINTTSSAYTDVHHLRAADMTVQDSRTTRHFGMCGTVTSLDSCVIPASQELGWDTARDDKIWQPPEAKRGEIARALLYMDLRYSELKLKDCEPFSTGEVGYLSQLLEWHTDYPPTDEELQRNNRACSRWQGNRNPFVDYPDLALVLHRSSQVGLTGCSIVNVTATNSDGSWGFYNSTNATTDKDEIDVLGSGTDEEMDEFLESEIIETTNEISITSGSDEGSKEPSAAPTLRPTTTLSAEASDPCNAIGEGNLPFFLVNTRSPDEVIFLSLQNLDGGMELYLTDQAWDGYGLVSNVLDEGTVMMTTPDEGISAGTLFGYGLNVHLGPLWRKVGGDFTLGLNGDNMFLYCLTNSNKTRFLSGFTNNWSWKDPFLDIDDYGHNTSALPDSLVNSSIQLPHMYNYFYNGERDARVNLLRRSILDPNEWEGSNELRYSIDPEYTDEESAAAASSLTSTILVMMMGSLALGLFI